jgi:hypothetical protein
MSRPEQPTNQAGKKPIDTSRTELILLIVILVIGSIGVGVGVRVIHAGPLQYGCLSVNQQGSEIGVSTSGLIHLGASGYYISCSEGATTTSAPVTVSCLTITPQTQASPYPDSSGMAIQYSLSAGGHTITLQGAPANATEITQPTGATIQVNCG